MNDLPMALRSNRLELRPLDVRDAEFVKSLYADARVTRTLLRIQGQITLTQACEFCQVSTTADGEHRFGAGLQTDGSLIAVGSVRWRASGTRSSPHSGDRAMEPKWLRSSWSLPLAGLAPVRSERQR